MRLKSNHDSKMRIRRLFTMTVVVILGMVVGQSVGADPSANSTANIPLERGAYLYETHCKSCHGDRKGSNRTAGASPHNEKGHSWHHPDAQLMDWVLNGKFRAEAMPQFKSDLTEEDVRAILLFIKGWWTPEQREIQQDVSRRYGQATRQK